MRNRKFVLPLALIVGAGCDASSPSEPLEEIQTLNASFSSPEPDQVCNPEVTYCGGGGGGYDECPGCTGLAIGGAYTRDQCDTAGRTDQDFDGLWDYCEYSLASAFKPAFYWDSGDGDFGREPYFAVRTYPDRSIRILYAIAYYRDGGLPPTGLESHVGDSEFVIVDVSFDNELGRWITNTVFMSAHFRQANDRSRFYTWSELSYTGHQRGRPNVYVSKGKHANYASDGQMHFYEVGNGLQPGSPIIESQHNLGSSTFRLVDSVSSWYGIRPGIEHFWSGSMFCGWSGTGCSTGGYGPILSDFGM